MKLGITISLTLFSMLAGAPPLRAPDEIVWLENYGDAIREAKHTGKPILLEFRCEA